MVAGTSMAAASLSGIFLGSFMCTLVVICHKFNRDPDDIVPAVASCLGDLFTLFMLGFVSDLLVPFIQTPFPLCWYFRPMFYYRLFRVRPLLKQGW